MRVSAVDLQKNSKIVVVDELDMDTFVRIGVLVAAYVHRFEQTQGIPMQIQSAEELLVRKCVCDSCPGYENLVLPEVRVCLVLMLVLVDL